MLYQVNARGLRPYYTASYLDALQIYAALKLYGPPCTMRRVKRHKVITKIYK